MKVIQKMVNKLPGALCDERRFRGPARGHVDEMEEPFIALIPIEADNIAVPRVQENVGRQSLAAPTIPGLDHYVIAAELDLMTGDNNGFA